VNGQNLGRNWAVGPQKALYLPGPWLKSGDNEVTGCVCKYVGKYHCEAIN